MNIDSDEETSTSGGSETSDIQAALLDGAERRFTIKEALAQERNCIEDLRSQRSQDGKSDLRFSLAFSGGGIRAAAFQAGVLWRLAQEDRLKDVEYLTAVSGGGYIASAFASHCLAEGAPDRGEVHDWYLSVVAKTIQRMQVNAGDFVRDCCATPCYSDMFSGRLPRFLDLPILLVVLVVTLMVHPVMFIICILVPFTIFVEAFFGGAMRSTFCSPPTHDWLEIFLQFSVLHHVVQALLGVIVVAFTVALLRKTMPCCKLRKVDGKKRPHASAWYLLGHASAALLKRASFFTMLLIVFVTAVPLEERFQYSQKEVQRLCSRYIHAAHHERDSHLPRCGDISWINPFGDECNWFEHSAFDNYTHHHIGVPENVSGIYKVVEEERQPVFNALTLLCVLVGFLLTLAMCLLPIIGPQLLVTAISFAGPITLLGWTLTCVQYVVFGPVTGNQKGILGDYDQSRVDQIFTIALSMALVLMPIYEDIRAGLHNYYLRCLRVNFFADGSDSPIKDLADHPYCPFLLLTGTSNDYQPPDDDDKISEISFSCLHTGGEETGYFATPGYRSLGKCAAISGAGCLDAISLSMSDALSLRFWLEVLNLSWGDYIILDHVSWLGFTNKFSSGWQGICMRLWHQMPQGIIWLIIFALLCDAWAQMSGNTKHSCPTAKNVLSTSGWALLAVVSMSFFSFLPFCDLLALSPMLRQLQQVTRYFFVGDRPPRMLYMTDGGVKDCTSIVQLLWRRRERILLVLAAADPNDELSVLRSALEVARKLKLASFYNPEDPRMDIDVLLERYKEDKEIRTLHLGISYSWDGSDGGAAKTGHLFIVKNRLPPSLAGPVRPPISEDEVMTGELDGEADETVAWDAEAWADMNNDDLGPFGCCDCCHTNGMNCGPKFPHGTFTGYLYLSPQWCSSLMRLGYAASKDAVERVCSVSDLAYPWERDIPH